jgi:DNA-binding NarL/FixJ family response regulator
MATHTVLLVEDDAQTRARLAEVIGTHPSLQLLDDVGSVAEGKAALREHRPDVLITDLGLPDGDGTELIREAVALDEKITHG